MKLNILKQIIKEEISEVLETLGQPQYTGLITFGELKQACIDNYILLLIDLLKKRYNLYYVGDIYNFDGNPWVDLETAKSIIKDNNSKSIDKLNQAKNVDELVNILDGLGFNEDYNFIHSTYAFIFDSILK